MDAIVRGVATMRAMRSGRRRITGVAGWRWAGVLLVAGVVVAGCDAVGLEERRMFGTTFPGGADGGLIVTVEDRTGRVVSLDVAEQLPGGQPAGAEVVLMRDPVQPHAFVVGWLGGDCDTQTTITVAPDDTGLASVAVRTEAAPGACDGLAIERAAIITMDGPVDLSRLVLVMDGDG
jgi:hypothetical protein